MIWRPPGASGLGWLVGMQWPEGNEDSMWAIADDWKSSAEKLRSIDADIDEAIAAVRRAYPTGDGGDKIIESLQGMRTGDQSIDKLAEWFETISGTANNTGTQLEYTKLMFYTTLLTLAADIAAAWLFPPTAPMAEGAIIGVGRITVRILTRRAIDFLGKEAEKATVVALKKFIMRQVLIGGAMGALQDGAIQAYQSQFGRRDGIDMKQLGLSAAGGAVGGLVAAPVGKYLPKTLLSPLSKDIAQKMVTQKAANLLGGSIAGGVAGLGGWAVSGGVTHNWHFDPRVVTAGIAGGTLPGVAHEMPSPWKGGEPKLSPASAKIDGASSMLTEQHKSNEVGNGQLSPGEHVQATPGREAPLAENAPRDGVPASEKLAGATSAHLQGTDAQARPVDSGVSHGSTPVGAQVAPNAQTLAHGGQMAEARPTNAQAASPGHTPTSTDARQVPASAPRAETPAAPRTEVPTASKVDAAGPTPARADAPGSGTPTPDPRAAAAPARDTGGQLNPMSTRATGLEVHTRSAEQTNLVQSARTTEPAVARPEDRELVGAGSGPASRIGARPEIPSGGGEPRPEGPSNHPTGPSDHTRGPSDQRAANHVPVDPAAAHGGQPHDPATAHPGNRDPEHPVLPKDSPITEAEHAHAREALDRLGPEATPEHLAHEVDTSVAEAHNRATENHEWWHSLSPEQQDAMLRVHPRELGNADGIPPHIRDEANRLSIARDINELREQNPNIDKFRTRFTDPESFRQWKNLQSTVEALEHANDLARDFARDNAGHEPPVQVLSYDSTAFGGEGRAVVAFGDTQHASTVSLHVPGITTTVRSLGTNLDNAFNHYKATSERRDPAEVASIAWIGYDAPSGFPKILREMTDARMAARGGQLLARDVAAFSQTRRLGAELPGGSPTPDVHLFGHSYGSTTTSFAGAGGRLSGDISTITLLGSPGAGPVGHAADFGIGAHNVFVASSSRDPVTWIGANTHGEISRMAPGLGNGLGMDPAIAAFGANRIAAQFPGGIHTLSDISTHTGYYNYLDKSGAVPTESLHNFARIANGETPHILPEYSRPGREDLNAWQRQVGSLPHDPARFRTPEPEVHQGEHPYGYGDLVEHHRTLEPRPTAPERNHAPVNDCGPQALRQVHELTGNPNVHVPDDPHIAEHGMTAAELENAAGAHLDRHETLGSIADQLHRLGDGATALVVDEFRGPTDANDIGAHAYTITNDGGRLVVHDNAIPGGPHPFPPDHTNVKSTHAIVYDSHGNPVRPLESAMHPSGNHPEARIGQPDSFHGLDGDGSNDPLQSGGAMRPRDVYDTEAQDAWANKAYEVIRASESDVLDMARNLAEVAHTDGTFGFSEQEIGQVKRHLFEEEHKLNVYDDNGNVVGYESRRYDASPAIAEAWMRLSRGTPTHSDILLLKHELAESSFLQQHPDAPYSEAHAYANSKANWEETNPERTGENYERWAESDGDPGRVPEIDGNTHNADLSLREQHGQPEQPSGNQQGRQTGGRFDEPTGTGGRDPHPAPVQDGRDLAGRGRSPDVDHRTEQPHQNSHEQNPRSEPAHEGSHPDAQHEPVVHESHPVEPESHAPAHDPIQRFETPEAARHYGDEMLAPIRDTMSEPELRELQRYTQKSWINEFLRAPNPMELLAKLTEDEGHYQQLMRITNGSPIMPKIEVLDRILAEHPDPRDPYLDPRLRAAIENVVNDPFPYGRLQELSRNASKLPGMREYFGGEPRMEILRPHVEHLDQAMNRPIPEGVEVSRGISMRSLDRFIGPDGIPLNGRNPMLLKGTIQTERGYMSTSLGPTPPQEFRLKVRVELDVPAGSRGAWVGDRGLAGPENEIILQRESKFLITDVIEDPKGARYDDGYVDYLIKGTLVPADYVHEPHIEVPETHHPNSTPDKQEVTPVRSSDGPDKDHIPFRLGNESQHPVESQHQQEGPRSEEPRTERTPIDPADRPSTLTPHLAGRFKELHERLYDLASAYHDPARAPELPGLRLGLNDLMDKLGMLDHTTSPTAMRLFEEYRPELAKYLTENREAFRPLPDDTATTHENTPHATDHVPEASEHRLNDPEHRPNEDDLQTNSPHGFDEHNPPADPLMHYADRTPAGLALHNDPELHALAHLVPEDPRFFTIDAHLTERGTVLLDGREYTMEELAARLPELGYDGRPIRLIGCDAASTDAAARLAKATNNYVLAPTKPAWTDPDGHVYSSTAETTPQGTRRPRIPPDGDWELIHPDGTKTKVSEDGFVPGTREHDKHGVDPNSARDRSAFVDDDMPRHPYEDLVGDRPVKHVSSDDPLAPKRRKPFGRDPKTGSPIPLEPDTAYRVTDKAGRDRGLFITGHDGRVSEVVTDSGRKQTRNTTLRRLEGEGFNPDLRRAFPDAVYTVDNRFIYSTDTHGRVVQAEGRLELTGSDDARRGPDQTPIGHAGEKEYAKINKQTIADFKEIFDREPSITEAILFETVRFNGGHLFGTEFGGPGEGLNIVPMLESLNQDPGNTTPLDNWRKLEGHWEHLLSQDPPPTLNVKISLDYDPHSPDITAPMYIDVEYAVDGTLVDTLSFKNIPPRQLP